MDELGAAAEGSVATRIGRSTEGSPTVDSALGVGLDYVGTLTAEQCIDLFRLAGLLRAVIRRQGVTSTEAKKRSQWGRLGALLALTDARRPTLATLARFADGLGVPAEVLGEIVAACPHAIAGERRTS